MGIGIGVSVVGLNALKALMSFLLFIYPYLGILIHIFFSLHAFLAARYGAKKGYPEAGKKQEKNSQ